MMDFRRCRICGQTKPLSQFYLTPEGYYRGVCTPCYNAQERAKYQATRDGNPIPAGRATRTGRIYRLLHDERAPGGFPRGAEFMTDELRVLLQRGYISVGTRLICEDDNRIYQVATGYGALLVLEVCDEREHAV